MPVYGSRRARAERPRARRTPFQGGADPRARRSLLEVSVPPSNGTESARGRRASSSEAKPARGDLQVGRLGGPLGPPRRGPCPAWLGEACLALALLRVLSGDFPVVKGDP
jgi:hypothetical protein